ncbi:MbtH family NRPS accessory protein [Streptomyces sp. NPDC046909]|uniref:MbtH family NRPS accessory protein n=1 Tax=Streptomyces sp. NPDC046909 TaxID=3155617 RepID=UPI0033E7E12E
MTPFDPGPPRLVLENAEGRLSLWPVWRDIPAGWEVRFGPAPYEACAIRLEAGRG